VNRTPATLGTATTAQPAAAAEKTLSINQVYEQAGPGVVEITVSTSGD
jgi:hypothetical protein